MRIWLVFTSNYFQLLCAGSCVIVVVEILRAWACLEGCSFRPDDHSPFAFLVAADGDLADRSGGGSRRGFVSVQVMLSGHVLLATPV